LWHNRVFWLPKALPNREEGEPNRTLFSWDEKAGSSTALSIPAGMKSSVGMTGLWCSFGRNDNSLMTGFMAQSGTAKGRVGQASTVAELARFFPEATPVRIPVELTRKNTAGDRVRGEQSAESVLPESFSPENTVIEFGTSREVLFSCTMPLEFADVLRLRNSDGSLDTEASVVAVQYHPGATVVAARFLNAVPNWIVKS